MNYYVIKDHEQILINTHTCEYDEALQAVVRLWRTHFGASYAVVAVREKIAIEFCAAHKNSQRKKHERN